MSQCPNCKKQVASGRKFCSPECLHVSMRGSLKACVECGTEFKPLRSTQKLCSLACFGAKSKKACLDELPEAPLGSAWVPLTQGKLALVDISLLDQLSKFNWCAVKIAKKTSEGHVYEKWYAKCTGDSGVSGMKGTFMHRYIMNSSKGSQVDHVNGDGLDNRAVNLRLASAAQNSQNMKSFGSSRYKGVVRTASGTFSVRIMVNRKSEYVGTFKSEEEAARAYDKAARLHHGRFARVNFPGVGEHSAITA